MLEECLRCRGQAVGRCARCVVERIVFEPYSQDIFEESRDWIRERGIFEGNDLGAAAYDKAVVRLAV